MRSATPKETWALTATLYRLAADGSRTDFDLFEKDVMGDRKPIWHVEITPPDVLPPDLDPTQMLVAKGIAMGLDNPEVKSALRHVDVREVTKQLLTVIGTTDKANLVAKLTALDVLVPPEDEPTGASQRQAQLIGAAALGLSYPEFARRIGMAQASTQVLREGLFHKLTVHGRAEAVFAAFGAKIITLGEPLVRQGTPA